MIDSSTSTSMHGSIRALGILAVLSLGSIASATLLVQDRFDGGYATGVINTQGYGKGWNGNIWSLVPTNQTGATFQSTSEFVASPPAGGSPGLSGGAINKAASNRAGNERATGNLADYFTLGESVWFSFLVAVRGTPGNTNNPNEQLNIGFSTTSQNTATGIGISFTSNAQMHARINNTLSIGSVNTPLSGDSFNTGGNNLSYYVVGEFTKGQTPNADVLNIWVNQGTTVDVNAPTMSVTGVSLAATPGFFSFNSVWSTQTGNHSAMWMDEINLATSGDALGLTVIPEPASLLLMVSALAGALAFRRRSRA